MKEVELEWGKFRFRPLYCLPNHRFSKAEFDLLSFGSLSVGDTIPRGILNALAIRGLALINSLNDWRFLALDHRERVQHQCVIASHWFPCVCVLESENVCEVPLDGNQLSSEFRAFEAIPNDIV